MAEARAAQPEDACSYSLAFNSTADLPAELADIVSWAAEQTAGYIWQRESFNLHIEGSRLGGRTVVGDCIDDEWFIVWLLREVTRLKPEVVASITDNDGQFLLIEAADSLPKWVTPANAENRVFISRGCLHLVPIEHTSVPPEKPMEGDELESEEGYIDPEAAITLVRDVNVPTKAPQVVEQAAWVRIAGYPQRVVTQHLHNTLALLPPDVAAALAANPQLVSQAVRTFYERDPVQLKACQFMSRFTPNLSSAKEVMVRMTRPLYAQLVAQRFYAAKPFEKAGWYAGTEQGSADYRRRDVGMKLLCGFEMLYQETAASLKTTRLARTQADPAYDRFRARLTELGYFRGEVQGSKLYTELEQAARARYEELPTSSTFAADVEAAIELGKDMPAQAAIPESDDKWLDLDEATLEEMLRAKGEEQGEDDEEEAAAQAEADKLAGFADKLGRFVEGEGSMEGALFDDEASDDDDDSDEEMAPTQEERDARLAELVPGVKAEEWGRKQPTVDEQPPPLEKPISSVAEERLTGLQQNGRFEGASDDEDDELEEIDEDEAPVLEGDADVDLASEMDDFLKFTREALGLSEDQYSDIIQSRRDRGAFVPSNKPGKAKASADLPPVPPSMRPSPANLQSQAQAARNPNLDSFEALMQAMDAELQKAKPQTQPDAPMSADDELDEELAGLLQRDDEDGPADYTLIKNFLESYRSQQGAGPVSNLAGRLGVPLPRSEGS